MPTLNVILHGLFAIHERTSGLTVYLPDMGDVHVYRAGSWLAETSIPRGSVVELNGVLSGQARFDQQNSLVVKKQTANLSPDRNAVQSTLLLPTPSTIHSLIPLSVTTDDFSGIDVRLLNPRLFPTVQVLSYVVSDGDWSKVSLDGHSWEAANSNAQPIQNLHILSEEEIAIPNHSLNAFERSAAILGLDLKLKLEQFAPSFNPIADRLPGGVLPIELEDLSQRLDRVGFLGLALRRYLLSSGLQTCEDSLHRLTLDWKDRLPTGSKVGSCSSIVRSSLA